MESYTTQIQKKRGEPYENLCDLFYFKILFFSYLVLYDVTLLPCLKKLLILEHLRASEQKSSTEAYIFDFK